MTLEDLKNEISEYQYFEDTDMIDISLASIIANRLSIGDPIWLTIVGPSSSGKSQILRPLALTDENFLHRIDDLTENTFLSGGKTGNGKSPSLLNRIGSKGIIVISDLTVLFSKNQESKNAILSQFRMLYDGEMTKYIGTQSEPLKWSGYLGIISGSTPSIYSNFEEVSDMGERFIYYRMKDFDPEKATKISLSRKITGKNLDNKLSELYGKYIKEIVLSNKNPYIPEYCEDRIIKASIFAEKIRTVAHFDKFDTTTIDKIPVPAMPMRIAIQLTSILKALSIMRDITEHDLKIVEWCAFSLANEEKRACLITLSKTNFEQSLSTAQIANDVGLHTKAVNAIMQSLASVKIVKRTSIDGVLNWSFIDINNYNFIRRICNINSYDLFSNSDFNTDEDNSSEVYFS